jgi:hopene-associated glycosyltransferase HpnB
MMSDRLFLGILILSLITWIYLLGFRGLFWQTNLIINKSEQGEIKTLPSVVAIVPARNEAELLPLTLPSLLKQNYPGLNSVVLVDDRSTDGTAKIAREIAQNLDFERQLEIITTEPLPAGWTGKLWAIEQGIRYTHQKSKQPDYFLLTDADIEHDPDNLHQLILKAQKERANLVSLMVLLRCQSLWEKFLIPAFVFFFQKLYPFAWVNNPDKRTAAAAGGCILIERQTLETIGGFASIRDALIDDCALAQAVKTYNQNDRSLELRKIWLGLTNSTRSLRAYPSLSSIWDMVARTAFTQLNYSGWLLGGTLLAMGLTYLISPFGIIVSLVTGNWAIAIASLFTCLLMFVAYLPTVKFYQLSPWWALTLSAIALLYLLMTFDSAVKHWQGKGGAWKGRIYSQS